MFLTLALVVLFSTILVFFSQEFAGLYRKFIAIPGIKLLLPLTIASCLVEYYEPYALWLLLQFKSGFHIICHKLLVITSPFQQ